jgi:hypothetical protein
MTPQPNRLELEAYVWYMRRQPGRNFYKEHSMDECIERLLCR